MNDIYDVIDEIINIRYIDTPMPIKYAFQRGFLSAFDGKDNIRCPFKLEKDNEYLSRCKMMAWRNGQNMYKKLGED